MEPWTLGTTRTPVDSKFQCRLRDLGPEATKRRLKLVASRNCLHSEMGRIESVQSVHSSDPGCRRELARKIPPNREACFRNALHRCLMPAGSTVEARCSRRRRVRGTRRRAYRGYEKKR
jgi:hypothetical protein